MSFSKDMSDFHKKVIKRATEIKRAAGIEFFSSIILDTPVDTGRAAGNWQLTLKLPAGGEVDLTPDQALSRAQDPNNYGTIYDVTYLTNNLPYIYELEKGHSQQAPHGMVRRNEQRIKNNLKKFIK